VFGTIFRIIESMPHEMTSIAEMAMVRMVLWSVVLNLSLAVFNMIPIFPLDGSKVLSGLLSPAAAARFQSLEPVGPFLLLGLIMLGSFSGVSVIGALVSPVVRHVGGLFTGGLL
jgi:Zn-dependent protease